MALRISFIEKGTGGDFALILLHGYGGSIHHWRDIMNRLSTKRRVILPNLTHLFYNSNRLLFAVQVDILAQFIEAHFPKQKVIVAGQSYGGALAWALSIQYPQLIEKTIFVNPLPPNPQSLIRVPELKYFLAMRLSLRSIALLLSTPFGKVFLRRAAQAFREERTEGAIRLETLRGKKILFVANIIHQFSWILRTEKWKYWEGRFHENKAPSLLIYDMNDLLFTQETYLSFARAYKCSFTHELSGAGHLATLSRPASIAAFIEAFLENSDFEKN